MRYSLFMLSLLVCFSIGLDICFGQDIKENKYRLSLEHAIDNAGFMRLEYALPPLNNPPKAAIIYSEDTIELEYVEPSEIIYWQTTSGIIICGCFYDDELRLPNIISTIIHTVDISQDKDYSNMLADILSTSIYTGRFIADEHDRTVLWSLYNPDPECLKSWVANSYKLYNLCNRSSQKLTSAINEQINQKISEENTRAATLARIESLANMVQIPEPFITPYVYSDDPEVRYLQKKLRLLQHQQYEIMTPMGSQQQAMWDAAKYEDDIAIAQDELNRALNRK